MTSGDLHKLSYSELNRLETDKLVDFWVRNQYMDTHSRTVDSVQIILEARLGKAWLDAVAAREAALSLDDPDAQNSLWSPEWRRRNRYSGFLVIVAFGLLILLTLLLREL